MSFTPYIVPAELLTTTYPRAVYHATEIPADPTKRIVVVDWSNSPDAEMEFESQPGVLPLGNPWDALPAEAVPLIASLQDSDLKAAQSVAKGVVGVDVPATPDTVATALRSVPWPGVRMR